MNILSWIFGCIGLITSFTIYQQKERKRLLIVKLTNDAIWMMHYVSLLAWSAVGMCLIAICRSSVFLYKHKKGTVAKKSLILFLFLAVISAVITWKNVFSLLPSLCSMIAIFSFWQANIKTSRILACVTSVLMIIYDLTCLSYLGIVNESFLLISSIVGLIRFKTSADAKK